MRYDNAVTPVPTTPPRVTNPIQCRLEGTRALSRRDILVLDNAETQRIESSHDIFSEGDNRTTLAFLEDGWACRYRLLGDGRRQIINFHVPGDLVGPITPTAKSFAAAVSECIVRYVSRDTLFDRIGASMSLSAAIEVMFAADYEMMAERTVSLGRRNAKERISHLFLELHGRLDRVGLVRDGSFAMPLTQEMIGDALGLSIVHVNRTLRVLRQEGLVTAGFGRATIHDSERLIEVAGAQDGSHLPVDQNTGLIPVDPLDVGNRTHHGGKTQDLLFGM
jgi:CRP-like cAMP-binding protein